MYQANIAKWKQDVTEDHLILHLPCYVFKKGYMRTHSKLASL